MRRTPNGCPYRLVASLPDNYCLPRRHPVERSQRQPYRAPLKVGGTRSASSSMSWEPISTMAAEAATATRQPANKRAAWFSAPPRSQQRRAREVVAERPQRNLGEPFAPGRSARTRRSARSFLGHTAPEAVCLFDEIWVRSPWVKTARGGEWAAASNDAFGSPSRQ